MAKINKQAVIQKLVDELNLYPGKDLIPSELADKILATYQINTQEVSVKTPTANVVESNEEIDGAFANSTIYTTPATGKFYLTNAHLTYSEAAAGNLPVILYIEVTINSVAKRVLQIAIETADGNADSISLNFQNPILLDQATAVSFKATANGPDGDLPSAAGIVGYTED